MVVYPSYAIADDVGWKVFVAGYAFQQGEVTFRKKMMLKLLQRAMRVDPDSFSSPTFKERIRPFFAIGEKGHRIEIQIGSKRVHLAQPTGRNGHFRNSFHLTNDELKGIRDEGALENGLLSLTARSSTNPDATYEGSVMLCQSSGLSIVSDVDDTIKISNVGNLKELLANTFLREFRSVGGMAEIYQDWADLGAQFHYVSSSPWQLFEPLSELRMRGGFPTGSIHLRDFRWRDQMFKKVRTMKRRGKGAEICVLLKNMPERRFLLIGDSSEKDPEIYKAICRRYPEQVRGLFIRQVSSRPIDQERLAKLNRSIVGVPVCIFSDPHELGDLAKELIPELTLRPRG